MHNDLQVPDSKFHIVTISPGIELKSLSSYFVLNMTASDLGAKHSGGQYCNILPGFLAGAIPSPVVFKIARSTVFNKKVMAEAEIINAVNHPNIVRLYELVEFHSRGNRLKALALEGLVPLHDVRLNLNDILSIVRQISGALDALHCMNIQHGDIKPANIMLNMSEGGAKLIDFGDSRYSNPSPFISWYDQACLARSTKELIDSGAQLGRRHGFDVPQEIIAFLEFVSKQDKRFMSETVGEFAQKLIALCESLRK